MENKNYILSQILLAFLAIGTSLLFLCSFIYLSMYFLFLDVDTGKFFISITDYTFSLKSRLPFFSGFLTVFLICLAIPRMKKKLIISWNYNYSFDILFYSIILITSIIGCAYYDASTSLVSAHNSVEINNKTYKLLNTFEKGFLVVESDNTLKFIYEDGKKIINLGKSSYLEDVARKNNLNNEQVVSKENNEK